MNKIILQEEEKDLINEIRKIKVTQNNLNKIDDLLLNVILDFLYLEIQENEEDKTNIDKYLSARINVLLTELRDKNIISIDNCDLYKIDKTQYFLMKSKLQNEQEKP